MLMEECVFMQLGQHALDMYQVCTAKESTHGCHVDRKPQEGLLAVKAQQTRHGGSLSAHLCADLVTTADVRIQRPGDDNGLGRCACEGSTVTEYAVRQLSTSNTEWHRGMQIAVINKDTHPEASLRLTPPPQGLTVPKTLPVPPPGPTRKTSFWRLLGGDCLMREPAGGRMWNSGAATCRVDTIECLCCFQVAIVGNS